MGNTNLTSLKCCNCQKGISFLSTDIEIENQDEIYKKSKKIIKLQSSIRRFLVKRLVMKMKIVEICKERTYMNKNQINTKMIKESTEKRRKENDKSSQNSIMTNLSKASFNEEGIFNLFNKYSQVKIVNIDKITEVSKRNTKINSDSTSSLTNMKETNVQDSNQRKVISKEEAEMILNEKTNMKIKERENLLDKFLVDGKDISLYYLSYKKKYFLEFNIIQYDCNHSVNINNEKDSLHIQDSSFLYIGTYNQHFKKYGFGVLLGNDSLYKYIGFFKKDLFHGKGRLIEKNGDYYEGYFKNGVANGYGKYVSSTGDIYIGLWEDNKRNGKGEEFFNDGSRYEGYYKNNLKHGKGRYVYADGSFYEGEFSFGVMNGKGLFRFGEGKIYSGDFSLGRIEGTGVFIWPDKKKYIGQYIKDQKNGYGIFIWPDNKRYEGEWKNGKQHGYGVYYSNGVKKYGYWESGVKQNWVDEERCLEIMKKIQNLKLNDIQSISNISRSSFTSI